MTLDLTAAEVMRAIEFYIQSKTELPNRYSFAVAIHWRSKSASVTVTKKIDEKAK